MQRLYNVVWVLLPLVGCNKGHQMGMYSGEQSEETNSEKNIDTLPGGHSVRFYQTPCKSCGYVFPEGCSSDMQASFKFHYCNNRSCGNCLELDNRCKDPDKNGRRGRCWKCCYCLHCILYRCRKSSFFKMGKRTNGDGDDCRSTNTDMTLL